MALSLQVKVQSNRVWHTDLKEDRRSLKYQSKEVQRAKQRYEFVDCSDGRRPNNPNTRKFVRTHVMHNYRRQQQIAAHPKPGLQDTEIESQENDAVIIVELECPSILSTGRWSKHPFDRFPIKTQPYVHDLLDLCESTAPHLSDHYLKISLYRSLLMSLC